jgi:rare lipoprotein A
MTPHALARSLLAAPACAAALAAVAVQAAVEPTSPPAARPALHAPARPARHVAQRLDRSHRQRVGKASIYAPKFNGRRMADGTRMDPRDNNAASKTLPLGSTAKVTDLQTGRSAVVTIRDRGPHVRGRIVDLSPATAGKIGLDRRQGVATVAVTPLSLPPPDAAAKDRGSSPGASGAERGSARPAGAR